MAMGREPDRPKYAQDWLRHGSTSQADIYRGYDDLVSKEDERRGLKNLYKAEAPLEIHS